MFYSGVSCDHCGKKLKFYGALGRKQLTYEARDKGWDIRITRCLCPDCKRKAEENNDLV